MGVMGKIKESYDSLSSIISGLGSFGNWTDKMGWIKASFFKIMFKHSWGGRPVLMAIM